jgi:hypothetical protein
MNTYYILNKNTRVLVRESFQPFNIDASVQPPAPLIQLVRTDNGIPPTFDPATQKLVYTFTDNDATFTRNYSYQIQAMTQAEMDAYQKQQQDETTRQQIKAVYQDLINGVGTVAQRQVRVEKAVAWLLRNSVQ